MIVKRKIKNSKEISEAMLYDDKGRFPMAMLVLGKDFFIKSKKLLIK